MPQRKLKLTAMLIVSCFSSVSLQRTLCQEREREDRERQRAEQEVADKVFEEARQYLLDRKLATEQRIERAVERRGRAAVVQYARRRGWRGATELPRRPGRNGERLPSGGRTSVGLTPITDLESSEYKGQPGGLYPGGKNTPPEPHLRAALAAAGEVRPLDADGRPSADGRIVLISNGMSNTTQEFRAFVEMANQDPEKSSHVVIVDCAQGGMEASMWADPDKVERRSRRSPWDVQDQRLKASGVSPRQVQVVWIKQARARPESLGEFPSHAEALKRDLAVVLRRLRQRFPNLRLAYLSSRIYAGYARSRLNPEPYAYEGAFSVRWLIEDQIAGEEALNHDPDEGEVKAPLLLWGPYLWADGLKGRRVDDLVWRREDLAADGTHPSGSGRQKVARQLLEFFKSDPTARLWFLSSAAGAVALAGTPAAPQEERETVLWPSPDWPSAPPAEVGLDAASLEEARRYALTAGGSGMIVRHGKVVMRWGDQKTRYDIKSATKSFGATMLGVAVKDGKIEMDAPARRYHPTLGVPPESNAKTGWLDEITVLHLATQTAGFEKPGGYEKLVFKPGTQWHYSDGGPNWLAECLTLQYRRDLEDVMFERVFTPLGITRDDLRWRNNQYREREIEGIPRREFGAGIHANVEALSRLGYLYLRDGRWKNERILPKEFVKTASRPVAPVVGLPERTPGAHGNASDHYGLLWWNNADGALESVPKGAYWAWGLYDSLIVVIPSLDLVVVRGGARGRRLPRKDAADHYDVLEPFLGPIVRSVRSPRQESDRTKRASAERRAPYPPSPVIAGIDWAPRDSIIRRARGSDNWPLTWADDDALYATYGDGWGFEPKVPRKLSLGLVRVTGTPDDLQGVNLRSDAIEHYGDGRRGMKGWGILSVNGVLYLWIGHADLRGGQAQLAWSEDHGVTWTYADWRFEEFGLVGFVNFGKDYAGARDAFVYAYSHDSPRADDPADRFILMRAPRDRIARREAWEFFVRRGEQGPLWSRDIRERGAVFEHPDACLRSAMTYNAGIERYLWWQAIPQPPGHADRGDTRFEGGFGVYDAAKPWGPWTTAYFTERWDTGPGEHGDFPSKWMSASGLSLYLVFSGDDCFSVRKATLRTDADDGNRLAEGS